MYCGARGKQREAKSLELKVFSRSWQATWNRIQAVVLFERL